MFSGLIEAAMPIIGTSLVQGFGERIGLTAHTSSNPRVLIPEAVE